MPSPCFKAVLFFFAFAALFISSSAAAPSLKDNLDSVFSEIKQDFEQIAASPEAQSGTAAELDKYFFEALKRNQPYYSLLRIDRKGFAVSEVIRMVEKPGVKKRKVTGESWYKYVSKKLKEYNGTIKQEENGRYYLFWAIPIIYTNKKGKESFAGAVALKVDFWDCFQRFTKNTQTPFSVRMGRMGFFSYLWSNDIAFIEAPLSIPGAKKMKVRYPKDAPIVQAPVAPAVPVVDSAKIKAEEDARVAAAQAKHAKTRKIIVAICALLLLGIAVIAYKVISARRYNEFLKDIEK